MVSFFQHKSTLLRDGDGDSSDDDINTNETTYTANDINTNEHTANDGSYTIGAGGRRNDRRNARFMTPLTLDEAVTIVELNGLSGDEMNSIVKVLKVSNAIRLKNEKKREVIAKRIFEIGVPMSAAFELVNCKHDSSHKLSEIALKIHRRAGVSAQMSTSTDNEKKIVWGREGSNK